MEELTARTEKMSSLSSKEQHVEIEIDHEKNEKIELPQLLTIGVADSSTCRIPSRTPG